MFVMNTAPDTALRYATLKDIPALVTLVTSAYRGDTSRAGWTTEADLLDGERIAPDVLRVDLERPRSLVVVLERAHTLLACAHVAEEDGAGYFGMFSVKPDLQGGGIGKQVLAECERIVSAAAEDSAGVRATVQRQQEAEGVALEKEAVEQISATYAFKANLQTIKAQDEMMGSLLNVKA